MMPHKSKETCECSDTSKDTLDSLTRLIGDQNKARSRVQKLCALMNEIDEEDPTSEIDIFKAVADPCRLRILKLLREGELCVCEIMTALNTRQSSTSHHLSVLKDAGLVKERRDGKWSYYRLSDGAVIELLKQARVLKDK